MAGKRKKHSKKAEKVKTSKKRMKKTEIGKENEKKIKKDKKVKFKDKHPRISLAIKIIILLILLVTVVGAGIVIGIIYGAFGDEFEITIEELAKPTSNSIIYDIEGNVIAELNGDENRKNITLEDMSPYLAKAYVSIEDERFEDHNGVDILRTGKAIVTYIFNGGSSSFGGSTITQQLVKNITNDKEDTGMAGMLRKLKEWVKAYKVERLITKPQILELYLNTIFVGGNNNCGVETGAYYYFNKSAHDLTLVECAFMAGINSAPNAYNPYGENGYGVNEKKTNRINNKTKTVLNKMLELGAITQEERDVAVKEIDEKGITFTKGEKTTNYSYHTDALINEVIADLMEEKELSKAAAQNYIETQGLHIYSTQTPSIQNQVQESMKNAKRINSREKKDENGNPVQTQAAIVVIDHKTGYVLGCVGGLGEKTAGGLNRVTQSRRSPGSTFKTIADVVPGLEEKIITAATLYNDVKSSFPIKGAKPYEPKNNLNKYRGLITVRQAIETSQNVPFVKIMSELTTEKGINYLEKMGITQLDKSKDGLSLSIGGLTNGASPLEMAAAYATIANNGTYIEPTFYTKVEDSDRNTILTSKQESRRAFSEATAYIAKDILTEPVTGASGTAKKCAIKGMDVAAKTGTSNDDKDRWLCGFTNYYTTAVWYGYDNPETVVVSGISPATLIWADAMSKLHSGLEWSKFKAPSNVVSAKICIETGRLASDKCTNTYTEVFEKGTIPQSCDGHIGHTICSESRLLSNEYCPATEIIYNTYIPEKETLGLWKAKQPVEIAQIPESHCTIHKKPEEPVKPVEPEKPVKPNKPSDEPDNEENTGNTTGNNTTGNTSGNTTGNNTAGNTTGNNTSGNTNSNNTVGNTTSGSTTGNTAGNSTTGNNTTGNNTTGNTTQNTNKNNTNN